MAEEFKDFWHLIVGSFLWREKVLTLTSLLGSTRVFSGGGSFWHTRSMDSKLAESSYLFDKLNTGLQIHTEVNENPINALPLILFLLEHEHVVVEKLLQPLVGEVDAKLLETVVLKPQTVSSSFPLCHAIKDHLCVFV